MSAQHGEVSPGESEGLIRTPKQLITAVLIAFIVPIVGIVLLAQLVTGGKNIEPAGSSARAAEIISERLRPVGQVWIAGETPPPGAEPVAVLAKVKVEQTGEQVYKQVCAACHTTGALNAPKFGDTAAWAKLIPEGLASLSKLAISGIRQMPARGGNPALTDLEVTRATAYLANSAGAKFKEPPVEAAPAVEAAASAPASAPAPAPAAAPAPEASVAAPATVASAAAAAAAVAPASATAANKVAAVAAKVEVKTAEAKVAAAPAGGVDGEKVYLTFCSACHMTGAAGAPKSGDKAAWAPRIKKGEDALFASVIKGLGNMPPKAGNPTLTDAQIRAAVVYQINVNR